MGDVMSEVCVSVIIPVYNCARYIRQAVDSALSQNVAVEIFIIDDCSQDDLDAAMQKYVDELRVHYLKNPSHLGVAQTRNRGISLAQGDYVAFLDADDLWAPDKLKKQLVRIREQGTVICSTARELMKPDGSLTGYIIPARETYTYKDNLRQNHINCSSVLMKTEVAREFPMHNDDGHEDYLMWLEVLRKYGRGCAVNEPLLKYRISNQGKSRNKLHSAGMTFLTYRHMGFDLLHSILYFLSYAVTGVGKYFRWFFRRS